MLRTVILLSMLAVLHGSSAQTLPEFNMADTTVTICKGILLDSEEGPGGNIYGNNEDLVFTIDAGSQITLVFQPTFCLEQGYDFLTFHNGPSINSPQIGPAYTGLTAPPPIVATSGVLTVHFVSDPTVAYCGFEAQWTSVADPPVPPVMSIPTAPACNSARLDVAFSYPVHCDSIQVDVVQLVGQGAPAVTAVSPVACVGGSTSSMQLTVDPPFDRNCPYTLSFRIGLYDRCDSLWYFTLTANTQISTCPIDVEVLAEQDTICAGACTDLRADVNGCLSYTYAWDQGLPPVQGPISVCPNTTTTYSVQVTEVGTGAQATHSRTIVVLDPMILGAPTSVCQSLDAFDLLGSPPGGSWSGAGILDSLAGTFDPDTAGPGAHVLRYGIPGGCEAAVTLLVDSMDAGLDEAACPGTDPFQIEDHTPAGGTWSGPYITPGGSFDPAVSGSYVVTYSAGSCSDTKTINVDPISGQTQLDTVCQSTYPFDIPAQPWGGRWSGAGIVDSLYGTFDPDEAEGGTHVLTYALHGCQEEFTIHVKPVDIGGDRSACPAQAAPFALEPAAIPPGGTWSGAGIVDPVLGTYDPVQAGDGWDEVLYAAPNGCVDTIGILVAQTSLEEDTLFFCDDGETIILDRSTTGRRPWDGSWVGPGVTQNSDGDWTFDPQQAMVGAHALVYEANTCSASLLAVVHPSSLGLNDRTFCEADSAFLIAVLPPGADLSGPGVNAQGLFEPNAAGVGAHLIRYSTPAACSDSVEFTVLPSLQARISGVQASYCSNAMSVDVVLDPPGGVFEGLSSTTFDPSVLPDGSYTLIYTVGSGPCASSDTLHFIDHPALSTEVLVQNNPICSGGGSSIQLLTSGGDPNASIVHQWNNGLYSAASVSVSPDSTTTYQVISTDGCSDAVLDSVTIVVHPPFDLAFSFSPMQCFGEPGSVRAEAIGQGSYAFTWALDSGDLIGDSIALAAGLSTLVTATNIETGCQKDSLVRVPSWPVITALFSSNPNDDCIAYDQREVTFIDLSNNAVDGFWVFDGDTVPYEFGIDPQYLFEAAGPHSAELVVWNEGACRDSLDMDLCIRDSEAIFIPDIFSPNGDGNNDVLYVRGPTIVDLEFTLFDRWGNALFRSSSLDRGWDGSVEGRPGASGVYVYMLVARTEEGERIERSGNITLVR